MKKVLIAALLLVSANLVLTNEFRNKLTQPDNTAETVVSRDELVAFE